MFCLIAANSGDCELGPSWLLWLCVVFGVLFLVMLCVNIFLCSAMTCSFSRTEVEVEPEDKAPSVYTVQDYDPYRSWSGSQYGSRFSLDHPGTRPLSAADLGRPLGPDHPGTRVLGPPSLPPTYTSLQTKSTYSNSRPGNNWQISHSDAVSKDVLQCLNSGKFLSSMLMGLLFTQDPEMGSTMAA